MCRACIQSTPTSDQNSSIFHFIVLVVFLVIVLVPVQLLFLGQELVRESFTEVIDLVRTGLEFSARQLLQASWRDILFVSVAILLWVRILELDPSHVLPDLFQDFWLRLDILDQDFHDLLHTVVLIPKKVVQEDDLELFLESGLLR